MIILYFILGFVFLDILLTIAMFFFVIDSQKAKKEDTFTHKIKSSIIRDNKVTFASPVIPEETFKESENVSQFINNLK